MYTSCLWILQISILAFSSYQNIFFHQYDANSFRFSTQAIQNKYVLVRQYERKFRLIIN